MSSDNKEDNSMGIVIEQSVNDFDGTKSSVEPDLGDDQAFPFIPGFGKNSGKDWSNFFINFPQINYKFNKYLRNKFYQLIINNKLFSLKTN